MRTALVWIHVGLMMVAFGASPLGRLGMRHLLSRASGHDSAQAILNGFARIFLIGGISVTASVCIGVALAWNAGLTHGWIGKSLLLVTVAGIGVVIEERWMNKLRRAKADTFQLVLNESVPRAAAFASPVLWLVILWLMIAKPA